MPEPRWYPAVVVDGLPTEWWLISAGRLVRAVPYVPGITPR